MPRFEREQSEYIEKVVSLNRVSKTVKGGRVMKFSALVVVGDGKGKVGYGLGKAAEVPEAIRKGIEAAKKNMITVTLAGTTIPHETIGVAGAGHTDGLVGDGGPGQSHGDHVLLGGLDTLTDCLGDLSGLAQAVADLALTVANDDEGGEFHHAAALDGLGNTVQGNDLLDILALLSFKSRHCCRSSSLRNSGRLRGRPRPEPSRGRDTGNRRGRTPRSRYPWPWRARPPACQQR